MNSIRQTQQLNKRELESAVPPSASWHADYRDTAYIYIGGFPFDLSEGDIITIFSQYGNPTHLNLIRDRETGKSKGFAFLKYEDQRSCDLAVDNLGGAEVLGRMLRVDHTRYKKRDDEDEETYRVDRLEAVDEEANSNGRASDIDDSEGGKVKKRRKRPLLKEERELEELMQKKEGEDDDPMKHYFIEEKKAEVEKALAQLEKKERHHHRHRGDKRRDKDGKHEARRHRHRSRDGEKRHHRGHRSKERQAEGGEKKPEGAGDDRTRLRGSSTSRSRSSSREQRRRGR